MIKFQDNTAVSPGKSTASVSKSNAKAEALQLRQRLLRDINVKWDRFSEADMALITNSETLAARLAERYGFEDGQAHRDVRAFLNGRHF